MSSIIIPIIVVSIIGLVLGIILVLASKFMAVKVDERIPLVRECLPGANCGACGFPGCDGYAAALVEDPDLECTKCTPGGASAANAIAEVLGRNAGDVVKKVAYVKCNGDCKATGVKMDYKGMQTCAGAKLLFGGNGKCTFGCMGFGDCERACPSDAIYVVDGLARVDEDLCTGCGICAKQCPNSVISILPSAVQVFVDCNNTDKGANTRKACTNGCIGCKLCEKNCPSAAITVVDNLASIDYSKCNGCGTCVGVCKPGALHNHIPC